MTYIPLQSSETLTRLAEMTPMERMARMTPMTPMGEDSSSVQVIDPQDASFIDVFRSLITNAIETNEQVDRDAIDIMLGNVDDLATVQANIEKANTAVEVLVTVKNEVLSAYNTIINMQI